MAISVVMPALEMAQETGKLVSWLKNEGDAVAKGEPLLEIETDKAVMEIESPGEGLLAGIRAQAGAEIPVGQTIAWIVRPGEAPPSETPLAVTGRHVTQDHSPSSEVPVSAPRPQTLLAQPKLSPKARRLAKEHGVDPAKIHGSGPGGEILASDILSAAASTEGTPHAAATSARLSSVARLMAERTTASWTTVPHFFLVREIDATNLNAAREELASGIQTSHGVRLTHTDLLVALVARTLAQHPRLNASWDGAGIRLNAEINIAVAIAVEDAVVAPVLHRGNELSLGEIALRRRELAERARATRLRPADLTAGTFTISNLGMYHVDAFSAILTPPQAGILAIGRIADRVIALDGKPMVRSMFTVTLSCDHRVVDGVRAAQFLDALALAMGNPRHALGLE